ENVDIQLGTGNDTFTLDNTIDTAIISVSPGSSDDNVIIKRIGDVNDTIISGDTGVDTTTVIIDGRPVPDQFAHLKINAGVETLVVDNRNNVAPSGGPVVWTVLNGEDLQANVGPGGAPALVLGLQGAGSARILGSPFSPT